MNLKYSFKIPGIINVVSDLNLPSDGVTDCYLILQTALNNSQPGTCVVFPQMGSYAFSQPLIVDQPYIWFQAVSRGLVTLKPTAVRINPVFCFGLRQNEAGNVVSSANRPDCYGILDRSFVSAPGILSGYRTLGTSFVLANSHPVQIGSRSKISGDHSWTYWNEETGITVSFAIQANQPFKPDDCLFEWGSHQFQPAPISISIAPDGSQRIAVSLKTKDMNQSWNTPFATFYGGNLNNTSLTRVQIWIDSITKTVGIIQDGVVQPIQWISAIPNLANGFQRNPAQYSFSIGSDLGVQTAGGFHVPDFTTYGFSVDCIAITKDPGNDGARYLNTPNRIAFLPGSGPPLRSLDLSSGSASDYYVGSAWIVPDKIVGGGINCGGLRNLVIQGGSPSVICGATLGLTIDNCEIDGYHQAIGNLPILASYPINIKDCILSGGDAAVSLWRSSVYMNNNVIERGGITSIRTIGCNLHSMNDRVAFTSGGAETCVEMMPEQYGGSVDITNIDIDSESASPFSDAIFRYETSPYTTCTLTIIRPNPSNIGPNAVYVDLVGHAITPGVYNAAKMTLDTPVAYTNNYVAVVRAGVGWFGYADTSLLGVKTIIGPNAGQIQTPTSPVTPVNP